MSNEITKREDNTPETVSQERWLKPPCDVFENENEWLITADLPGVAKEALSVHLDKNDLLIEGRCGEGESNQALAGFQRTFTIPSGVDGEKVTAELENGVVSIHLPKSAAIKPRQVTVTAG